MVTTVHQQLTPGVYTFIFDASTHEDEEDQNQAPNAGKKAKKARKEGKQIGLLVKAIEEWEFNLIKLTRNCKTLGLCCSCHCCCYADSDAHPFASSAIMCKVKGMPGAHHLTTGWPLARYIN